VAWRSVACLLALAASLYVAQAATSVGGTITNGDWTSSGSPYLVTNDIQVAGLNIRPGVEVRFQGPYVFEVAGVLQAQGSLNSPIVFTNAAGVVGWNSLYFHDNSLPSSLTYCHNIRVNKQWDQDPEHHTSRQSLRHRQ